MPLELYRRSTGPSPDNGIVRLYAARTSEITPRAVSLPRPTCHPGSPTDHFRVHPAWYGSLTQYQPEATVCSRRLVVRGS
jgi:hypothetical protein